jgi:ABC-type transporter Mla subunit MlaD
MAQSPVAAFAAKQNEFNARAEAAIQGIGGDITKLNDLITTLQNSAGQISPEDQATLDQLQTAGEAVAKKFEALDALTPPAVPAGDGGGINTI